jgi:hypothetical protein
VRRARDDHRARVERVRSRAREGAENQKTHRSSDDVGICGNVRCGRRRARGRRRRRGG